jgi:hypothetical protein
MTHKPMIHLVLVAALLITAPMSLAQSNIQIQSRPERDAPALVILRTDWQAPTVRSKSVPRAIFGRYPWETREQADAASRASATTAHLKFRVRNTGAISITTFTAEVRMMDIRGRLADKLVLLFDALEISPATELEIKKDFRYENRGDLRPEPRITNVEFSDNSSWTRVDPTPKATAPKAEQPKQSSPAPRILPFDRPRSVA